MKNFRKYIFIAMIICLANKTFAQNAYSIPAFTGYAIPIEKISEDDKSNLFNENAGVENWWDQSQKLHYYFFVKNEGLLNISLLLKSKAAGNKINVKLANK